MAGHRVRAARGTAAAVAAMAALTASQAPAPVAARAAAPPARQAPAEQGPSVSGDTPYRTDLPPLRAAERPEGRAGAAAAAVPASVFAAYRRAEAEVARTDPGCGLRWELLAAIGQVESGQARGGRVTADGTTRAPILGPRLDGNGFALIRDTDDGAYDGDRAYDRAAGPMQFIPSTWARWGADGNGDGRADPHNVYDAALAAGRYLCAGGRDLSEAADLERAILGYNHSRAYLRTVLAWYGYFLGGHHQVVPDATGSARPEPSPSPSARKPAPSRPAPAGPASPTAAPRPEPSETPETAPRPSPAASAPAAPVAPPPRPPVELPTEEAPPLLGGVADSIAAAPSTTAATRR
ncbi:lytic transglycosylase domain-containing protein [Streptomyces sp.]|uniref:lytic transglycosylase domain-containing protein n=1 Tax=Streptomyces sp. TaxID=1931 RepID=UPI002D338542|nr:lytic murein transglycosylase [Streptomyces sp.]HZF90275.1 lytic murein transglycosylase [Streptomyces sp.]